MSPELPVELYYSILGHVKGRRELARLCQASRTFLAIAQPTLYHSLRLVGPTSTVQLCLVLIRTPRLAELVDEVVYQPFNDSYVKARLDRGYILPSFFRVFAAALRACTHLKRLSLKQDTGHDFLYSWVLYNVRTQLTHLSMVFMFDGIVIQFFRNQRALEHFELLHKPGIHMMSLVDGIMSDVQLSSHMWDRPDPPLPALSVKAPFWVLNFFPDRPIKAYEPQYPVHLAYVPKFVDNLAHSNGIIRTLRLPIIELPTPLLFSCIARLTSLQAFCLLQRRQDDIGVPGVADSDLNSQVIDPNLALQELLRPDILVSFRYLTALGAFQFAVDRNSLDTARQLREQLAHALFNACPSLTMIAYTSICEASVWEREPDGAVSETLASTSTAYEVLNSLGQP